MTDPITILHASHTFHHRAASALTKSPTPGMRVETKGNLTIIEAAGENLHIYRGGGMEIVWWFRPIPASGPTIEITTPTPGAQ